MTRRRVLFVMLVALSMMGMLGLMVVALSPGGWSTTDIVALVAFVIVLPWLAVGFWNALIGLVLDLVAKDPLKHVNPLAVDVDLQNKVELSTALVLCIRNETPARLVRNLDLLVRGLLAGDDAQQFHVYVLSDTTHPQIAEQEVVAFEQLAQSWQGQIELTLRRRQTNEGYKAGNIQDFCERWAKQHEFAVVLDADSVMSASAVRRLVLIMQANPQLGILQGLVVGLPAVSAFTRLFQFGMRLGMRSFTLGSAWWQGDCGPYWGHNAVIRLAPFVSDCRLPVFTDQQGKQVHILSHDQVEAVMMRRAGFDVRVYPLEDDSFEENPPNLIDFVVRDLRWCAGNMQYWRLIGLPGLKPTSRVQLVLAMLMFVGAPAWLTMLSSLGWAVHSEGASQVFDEPALQWLLLAIITMTMLPKIASATSVLLRAQSRRSFGGGFRFMAAFLLETVFSVLVTPVLWVSQTLLLAGMPFGKRISWTAQNRDELRVSWATALRAFGLHTAFGLLLGWLWIDWHEPATWLVAYFLAGLWLVLPLAVVTSSSGLSALMRHWRLAGVPQEFETNAFLSDLTVHPALGIAGTVAVQPSLDSSG
jgi:membrane glycosyltransferase